MNPVRPLVLSGRKSDRSNRVNPVRPLVLSGRKSDRSNRVNPVRPPSWYYCYVLKSDKNGNFYAGVALNLELRLSQHNKGDVKSTKHMRPLNLIYFEAYLDKDDAFRRERYLKSGMGKRDLRNRLKGGLTG